MTYGNGDYVDYSYDNFGNVRERSQNGTVTYRAYADNTGAVTREVDESNNVEYNYLYDSTDRLVSKKASYISAASGARSFKSSFSYDYDLNNNVTKFSVLTAKGPITTDYTYGLDNLPLTATFQSGKVLTNTFDKLGRLTKTNLNTNSNIETTYTYLASGYEGDYTTNFVEIETNGVFTYKYEYDANGNITKLLRKNLNGNFVVAERYTYNALDELTQVNYYGLQKKCVYTYDAGGNILSEKVYDTSVSNMVPVSTVLYEYGDNNWKDKLTSYGGSAITYDAIGNPLSYRGMTLTWQNGRQLASSSDGSTVTNYTYSADGMRMTKKVGSSTTYYQYFNGLLIQEIKGTKILDYSYDANGQVCAVRYRTNSNDEGAYYYYAHNTRGDIVGLYNADGSLHAKYSYDVWGNPLSVTDASNAAITSQTDIANLQSFRYRGYYYDSNSGFYYLQSRYYDPVTHRFINADGLVSTGTGVLGYNMFAYCENNPICYKDYLGNRNCEATSVNKEKYENRKIALQFRSNKIIDITKRLNNAMSKNSQILRKEMISLRQASRYTCNSLETVVYVDFINKVRPGGDWDFKSQPDWNLTPNYLYRYNNQILRYDDIGNIHYGYVGRELFGPITLAMGEDLFKL